MKKHKFLVLGAAALSVLTLSALSSGLPALMTSGKEATPPQRSAAELPFVENFDDTSWLETWSQVNNQSQIEWTWTQYDQMAWLNQQHIADETGCDNWLITPELDLHPGMTYQVSFDLKNWFDSEMHVYLVRSTTDPEDGKVLLFDYIGNEWGKKKIDFEVNQDGPWYIGFHDVTPYRNNGTALSYQLFIDNFRLEMLSNNATPEAIGDLCQVPGQNGELTMGLKWTNPKLSLKGEELDVLKEARIYKDGVLAQTIEEGVTPGAKMTWTDPSPTAGEHSYGVIVANTTGDSPEAKVNTFIGIDIPGAPEELYLDHDADAGVVTLEWEKPQFGIRGGWYDPSGLTYRVVRQPGHKVLATNLTATTYEDSDLSEYGNYIYQVTSMSAAGTGGTAETRGLIIGQTVTLPLREGWEDPTTLPTWSIVDNNEDGKTFYVSNSNGNNSASAIGSRLLDINLEWDESIYSPPVKLEKGKKYRASFDCLTGQINEFSLDITYGKEKTRKAQKYTIEKYQEITSPSYQSDEVEFTAQESGTFYFSWWIHNATGFMWFDNFRIEEVLDNNLEAVSVKNIITSPSAGDKLTSAVTYRNTGSKKAGSFKVQLLDDSDNILGEETVSSGLATGTSASTEITWTVPQVIGKISIRGRVVMEGDQCGADNTSEPTFLTVQKPGIRAITTGSEGSVSADAPFQYYGQIYSQSIYKGEYFGNIAGDITSMSYKVLFGMGQDFPEMPFRLYLCNTDKEDNFEGWMPLYSFTKVFEGNLDLVRGNYELNIPFDKPFQYNGGNLCVLLVSDFAADAMINNGHGMRAYVTEQNLGATRSLPGGAYLADTSNIPDQSFGFFRNYVPDAIFYIDHTKTMSVSGTVKDADGNPVEGAEVIGSNWNTANLKAVTDAEGKYVIPYVPSGYQPFKVVAKDFQDGNGYINEPAGTAATLDFTINKCAKLTVAGKVTLQTDGTTPVKGAKITLKGDNEFETFSDENGDYSIEGVYAYKAYPVFLVEAPGYTTINYANTRFYGQEGDTYTMNFSMTPPVPSPYSVSAKDLGETAEISWTAPIEDIVATRAENECIGKLGGAADMRVGHRYFADELEELQIDGDYYVQSIGFVPTAQSKFTIAIWQGEPGKESLAYMEEVTPTTIGAWNDFTLSEPYKVDTEKSIVVGYMVEPIVGAFPIGFDAGPVVGGGDCMFNPDLNEWSSAHEMVASMNYNFNIRATFGNYRNTAPIAWLNNQAQIVRFNSPLPIEEVENVLSRPVAEKVSGSAEFELLDSPLALAPAEHIPASTLIKGYNVYRITPGQENGYTFQWTKLNTEPVEGLSFTDETWGEIENQPYRFAVMTFFGNQYAWGDGVVSKATFSDGVDKGRYGNLTINVNTDKGSAEGTIVRLTGDGKTSSATVAQGENSVTFEGVRFTDYQIVAYKPFYETAVANVNFEAKEATEDIALNFAAPAPSNFDAVDYISETQLAWNAPTSAISKELTVGNNVPGASFCFSPGSESIVGQRSTPEMRADMSYTDFYINALSFYANATQTYSPVLWEENRFGQQSELLRLDYTVQDYEVGSWITVRLDEPVKIDPKTTYFYGYAVTCVNGKDAIILDAGPQDTWNNGLLFYMLNQKTWKYEWTPSAASGNLMAKMHVTDTPNPVDVKEVDVKFDVYRLAAADADNESKWTKITSTALDETAYADEAWQTLEDKDWQYAVKSLFGEFASQPTLSKVLAKGKVSLLSVEVATNNGASAQGAHVSVSRAGKVLHTAEVDADGKVVIPEVVKAANYKLEVEQPGFETASISLNVTDDRTNVDVTLEEVKAMPGFVEVFPGTGNAHADIQWRKPGAYAPREGWVYWDNNTPYGGYGSSTGMCLAAQLFTPEDQAEKGMTELAISRISFFPTQSSSNPVTSDSRWTVKVWRINPDMSVDEMASTPVRGIKLNQWNEVELEDPYYVNGQENLLVGYEFKGSGNAMGIDNGPCATLNGDWVNFGTGWQTLSSLANTDYNNLIHTYCENLNYRQEEAAPALASAQSVVDPQSAVSAMTAISRADMSAKPADHERLAPMDYPVKGYLVYRMKGNQKNDESEWTLLTPQMISETSHRDISWANVEEGIYTWAVKAVYASGNSEPAFFNYGFDQNGNFSSVEALEGSSIIVNRIGAHRFAIQVAEEASLTITNAEGIATAPATLKPGTNLLETEWSTGVCIFRIVCGSEEKTVKFIL